MMPSPLFVVGMACWAIFLDCEISGQGGQYSACVKHVNLLPSVKKPFHCEYISLYAAKAYKFYKTKLIFVKHFKCSLNTTTTHPTSTNSFDRKHKQEKKNVCKTSSENLSYECFDAGVCHHDCSGIFICLFCQTAV